MSCRIQWRWFHVDWLQISELLQVEFCHLILDHRANGKVADEHLEEDEEGEDDVDGRLEGEDDGVRVGEEEEDERQLEEDRQHPEASQLRNLQRAHKRPEQAERSLQWAIVCKDIISVQTLDKNLVCTLSNHS